MGAATSSLLTGLFSDTSPDETDSQREAKRNLILSLVTGVAAVAGGDAATANNAGTAAVDNNWLSTIQEVQRDKELAAAETLLEQLQIVGKWSKTSIRQDVITSVGVVQGLTAGAWGDVKGVYEFLSAPVENLTALGQLISTPEMREKLGSDLYDKYMNQINSMMYSLQEGGDFEAFELGRNMGDLLWDISSTVVAVKGVAKGVIVLSKVGINTAVKTTELAENGLQILTKSEVAAGKGAGAGVAAVQQSHVDELAASGVKFTQKNLVATTKTPEGKVVFLETGNSKSGLLHIIQEHAADFANVGISQEQIPSVIMKAVGEGKIVGYQGAGTGRPIYEVTVNGKVHNMAITVSENGYIVGTNPKGIVK